MTDKITPPAPTADRSCGTCAYLDVDGGQLPCRTCGHASRFDAWKPAPSATPAPVPQQAPVAEHAEPFAWVAPSASDWMCSNERTPHALITPLLSKTRTEDQTIALYTAPQAPQQAELTDEQIMEIVVRIDPGHEYLPAALRQLARAVITADRAIRAPGMGDHVPGAGEMVSGTQLDAARYRWLRTRPIEVPAKGLDVVHWVDCGGEAYRGDKLDVACDEAMAAESSTLR